MTARALLVLAVVAPSAAALNGCIISTFEATADPGPGGAGGGGTERCVARYQVGDQLKVRLGAVYDAASDYLFEQGWLGPSLPGLPSCGPRDGLQTGSVVTLTLTGATSPGGQCVPWQATLQPEAVVQPAVAGGNLIPTLDGVTIAVAIVEGTFSGRPLFAFRGLMTPSRDPDGALTPAALPPLVFTRELDFSDKWDRCFDAWIATWEP